MLSVMRTFLLKSDVPTSHIEANKPSPPLRLETDTNAQAPAFGVIWQGRPNRADYQGCSFYLSKYRAGKIICEWNVPQTRPDA
jgi:hypothetical protein